MGYKTFNTSEQTDFNFLIKKGLKPNHRFLDVGCGGGRLGYQAISYLNQDRYFAFDKETSMIKPFLSELKDFPKLLDKNPTIYLSGFNMEFEEPLVFDFIYAHSVLTHVTPDLIAELMNNLRKHFSKDTKFFATFHLGTAGCDIGGKHGQRKNEVWGAWYTIEYLTDIMGRLGFRTEFVGTDTENWESVKRVLYSPESKNISYSHRNAAKKSDDPRTRFTPYSVHSDMLPEGYNLTRGPDGHQEMVLITMDKKPKSHRITMKDTLPNNEVDPLLFLNSSRFDILAKYIYGLLLLKERETSYGEDLYYNHLKVWNDCQYGDGKKGIEEYKNSFKELLSSIQKEGFNPQKSKVYSTADYRLINGGHRAAACILLHKPICFSEEGKGQTNVDYSHTFFKNRKSFAEEGLETKYCDSIALEYCKIKPNTFIATIFPSAEGDIEEAERIIATKADIFYKKSLKLNPNGALNLMRQMYNGEQWGGTPDNNYAGLKEKARLCFQKEGDVNVYAITVNDPKDTAPIKKEVRKVFGIGNHSIHINDTREETFRLSRGLFNNNSIDMMNVMKPNYYPDFEQLSSFVYLSLLKNGLDPDNYCITASSVLSRLGLREGKDLDYLHRGPTLEEHPSVDSHNEYSKGRYAKTIDDIIYNPENHFYFNGLKYASLEVIKDLKEKRGEEKDKKDLELINELLKRK
jgi:SAM-dependent methyltransferase